LEAGERELWSLERLLGEDLGPTVVWATPSVRRRSEKRLPYPHHDPLEGVDGDTRTLIVVGGGTLIDQAKLFRRQRAAGTRLVAIPSIWGSGAESSPVVVTNEGGGKCIRMGAEYLPDARVSWPELADSVPPALAVRASGDAWSHALEGLLSPLADETVQRQLAAVVSEMLELPLSADPRWFEPSAAAARLQARSSVGLVHGIAHTLEGPLRAAQGDFGWNHAVLCATFLWPVMALNLELSDRARGKLTEAVLDPARVLDATRRLFEEETYDRALPELEARWKTVLRDPCTRTNGALVRASHIDHFRRKAFLG